MSAIPETTGFKPKKSVALSGTAAALLIKSKVGYSLPNPPGGLS